MQRQRHQFCGGVQKVKTLLESTERRKDRMELYTTSLIPFRRFVGGRCQIDENTFEKSVGYLHHDSRRNDNSVGSN